MGEMSEAVYEDELGRKFKVMVPDGGDPEFGVVIGPPYLDELGLPDSVMVRLHNELFYRRLFTLADVRRRPQDIDGALRAAFKLDVQKVMEAYRG